MKMRDAEQPLLHCGIGDDHDVILILPHGRLSLPAEHADYPKRRTADADNRAIASCRMNVPVRNS